jgi:hypothetical protein
MIVGTEYSPGKAFINFARDFIRAVAQGDFGTALAGLDTGDDGHRWSKADIVRQLSQVVSGHLSVPEGIVRSAEPTLAELVPGEVFALRHRLPVDGKWSNGAVSFRFERKRGEYFRVVLVGFERAA